jgi:hypothetical protein
LWTYSACEAGHIYAERENYYIGLLDPKFNIKKKQKKAGSRLGHNHSDKTQKKMSAAHNSGRFKKEKCLEKKIIYLVKPRAERAGRPS